MREARPCRLRSSWVRRCDPGRLRGGGFVNRQEEQKLLTLIDALILAIEEMADYSGEGDS